MFLFRFISNGIALSPPSHGVVTKLAKCYTLCLWVSCLSLFATERLRLLLDTVPGTRKEETRWLMCLCDVAMLLPSKYYLLMPALAIQLYLFVLVVGALSPNPSQPRRCYQNERKLLIRNNTRWIMARNVPQGKRNKTIGTNDTCIYHI